MQLPEALFNLTSTAAETRTASEDLLRTLPEDQLVLGLLQCLGFECPDAGTQTVVRSMAAVVLRRKLTGGTAVLYLKLTPPLQAQVRSGLLEALSRQVVASVGRKVCDAVVDLAVVIHQEAQWEELLACLGGLLASGAEAQQLFGFRILQQLLEMAPPKFTPPPTLRDVLQAALSSSRLPLQVAAVKAYAAALTGYDELKDRLAGTEGLALRLLEHCLQQQREAETEEVLRALVDLMDSKPQAVGDELQSCVPTMIQVCRTASTGETVRRLALDFTASAIEGNPKQPLPVVQEALRLCMALLMELEDDPHWASQGTDYDTADDALVEAAQMSLTRLVEALPSSIVLPAMSVLLSEYAHQADWKPRHAALLAIVQVCDELKEDHVRQLVPYVIASLKDSSPRVQWAAAQAASQVLTEHGEWLAEEYHEQLMPILLEGLQSAAPRVVAWVCAALRDLCEHLAADDLVPSLPRLLGSCLTLLQAGPWFVAEKAFQTVSWVSDVVDEKFQPYYPAYKDLMFQFIEHPQQDRESLRGRAMECLTSVGRAVGRDTFRPAAQQFLERTLGLELSKTGQFPTGWSAYYILAAWRRTVGVMQAEMTPYLPRLVPVLLCVASAEVLAEGQWAADDESDTVQWVTDAHGLRRCVNPTLLEAKTAACEVLGELMAHCKTDFWPYLSTAVEGIAALLAFPLDGKVRSAAAQCLAKVVDCAGDAITERGRLAAKVVQRLLDTLATEEDAEALVELLKTIREALRAVGAPLAESDPGALVDRLLVPLESSAGRATKAVARHTAGAIDEEELQILRDWEEAAMLRVVSCVGAVLATQGEAALAAVDVRLRAMLTQLTPSADQLRWLVTLGVLAEVVSVAPPPMFEAYFTACIAQVKDSCAAGGFFTPLRSLEVRRFAYATLGVFARRAGAAFGPHVPPTVSLCTTLLSTEFEDDDEDQQRLRDTAAAALGLVFEHHMSLVQRPEEALDIWLEWLPVKSDDEELAEACTAALCGLVLSGPLQPAPHAMERFTQVLAVLGTLDPADEGLSSKLKAMVRSVVLLSQNLPGDVLAKALRALSSSQRRALEKWKNLP
eukprot:EG_transcript_1184